MIPRLIIVIPCYNEQEVLPITAPQFLAKINQLASEGLISGDSRVMFVNDADKADDNEARRRALIQVFHMIRTAAVLLHPMAPQGTEMILEYLQLDKSFWSWDKIFDTISDFTGGKDHKLKFLEPRVDFFTKHQSQFNTSEE